ncbi:MAG: TatD family hydrolase [Lachnospiraceae bacterium]|nr:TatD family hydrolase [Lachnospiraceae bacterium]
MIIDTHAHYDDEKFDGDRDVLLTGFRERGVELVINAAADLDGCRNTMELINKYDFVYGMQGVHPDDVGALTEEDMTFLRENAKHPKVVAIGEIGLDYYWDKAERDVQKYWFKRQIDLARELKLPVCIHSREAAADTLEVLKEANAQEVGGVMHCYSYSAEMTEEYRKLGFYFGIGGVVTFKNGRKCKESVAKLPLECIVLETDAPYLAPEPFRGKRNESPYIQYVVQMIASIKGVTEEEVMRQTSENARRVYPKLASIG